MLKSKAKYGDQKAHAVTAAFELFSTIMPEPCSYIYIHNQDLKSNHSKTEGGSQREGKPATTPSPLQSSINKNIQIDLHDFRLANCQRGPTGVKEDSVCV